MNVKSLKDRVGKIIERRRLYDGTLREIYDYMMPTRESTGLLTHQSQTEASRRNDKIFDATAVKAGFRFAGRMQTELTPPFQRFFALKTGPLVPEGDEKKKLDEELQRIGSMVDGVLSSGSFHQRAHEMYLDLFAGTGAMLMERGDSRDILRFRTVPISEIALEEGAWGDVWGVVWERSWPIEDIPRMWDKAELSDHMRRQITSDPMKTVKVTQYTRYDPNDRKWHLTVWCDAQQDAEKPIHTQEYRTKPWLTPRFFVIPGEPYGRGPAHLALPSVKTLNKVRELELKAASFAVLGVWMYRDDSVFNPDTVRMSPLSMWRVGTTGGPLGPSVQRLPVPDNFDVSNIVMQDERLQVKQATFDDTLPPEAGAVRSATEIAERMRTVNQDIVGVLGRLQLEIAVPLIQRSVDVMEELGLLKTNITIDQMLTQVSIVSPIAASQQAARVKQAVDWLQMVGMLGGPQVVAATANVEKLFPQMGRWLGVDEKYIRSDEDIEQIKQAAVDAARMQAQAEAAAAAPAEEPPVAADYVNGGAF